MSPVRPALHPDVQTLRAKVTGMKGDAECVNSDEGSVLLSERETFIT